MNPWTRRRVLVTGATGLLGGWLTERLVSSGADVTCIVRDHSRSSRFFAEGITRNVDVAWGDVTDQHFLERVVGEYEISTVFHLAAQTIVTVAQRNPISTFDTNLRGTWSLLEACRRVPTVTEVVVASSDKAYGTQTVLPYTEDMPMRGSAPYDVSKSCADLISQAYATTYGMHVGITRCGNFFGGGDLNWNRLVPGIIRDLHDGRSPVIRSSGKHVRDYLYIEDGVEGYIRLAEELIAGTVQPGTAFNFSLNAPKSVLEIVELITETMGSDIPPTILGGAQDEITEQHLDSTAARDDLGWTPRVGLREGIRRTVDWYQHHLTRQR